MPKVLNKYKDGASDNSVYIGRPSKWGNPFEIGVDGTRDEVVQKYTKYLFENTELLKQVKAELKGKDLVCFCAPKKCHGDLLLFLANIEIPVKYKDAE